MKMIVNKKKKTVIFPTFLAETVVFLPTIFKTAKCRESETGKVCIDNKTKYIIYREVSPIWTRRPDILKIDNL